MPTPEQQPPRSPLEEVFYIERRFGIGCIVIGLLFALVTLLLTFTADDCIVRMAIGFVGLFVVPLVSPLATYVCIGWFDERADAMIQAYRLAGSAAAVPNGGG